MIGSSATAAAIRGDHLRLVRDAASGVEAIEARFSAHAYDLHRHDEWLVGVTDHGVQDFFCRGARRRSAAGRVILIEPEEAHDGQAGSDGGFAYRMLYLPRQWLTAGLMEVGEPGFRTSLCDDVPLGRAIRVAYGVLARPANRLERDAELDRVLHLLRPHLGRPVQGVGGAGRCGGGPAGAGGSAGRPGGGYRRRRAGIGGRGGGPVPVGTGISGDPGRRRTGSWCTPGWCGRRHSLAAGRAPADVAAECGFADQSHFGRWFRRAYGHTPAAYRALCTGVPDRPSGIG